jgi:hypothetical protein
MEPKPFHRRKSVRVIAIAIVAIVAVIFVRPRKPDDSVNVPLGVEQAAIVTYSGPPVAVAPYKWGVAVNVRIAKATEQAGARVYDVRYIVNREGTVDLRDYLVDEDGSPLEGLPSFQFHGDPKLSKNLDARIQETEEVRIDVGGHYYATLLGLGVFWIVWLLLLIFYKRPKPPQAAASAPPQPTFTELLRAYLGQLEAGTLDAAAKAKLEMLLLRHWREEAAASEGSMSAALNAIGQNEETGELLRQLESWLHHPASSVRREEIAAVLNHCLAEAKAGEVVPA